MMCGAADSWWPSRGGKERGSKQIGRAARGIQVLVVTSKGWPENELGYNSLKLRPQTAVASF